MMIPAFVVMLRFKDPTVAAGSNQHGPLKQTEAGGVQEEDQLSTAKGRRNY